MRNPQVKMVLSDVDGTLLSKENQNISKEIFDAITFSASKNISFVIASGRNLADLEKLFSPVKNLLTFISNDGTLVLKNGEVLYEKPILKDAVTSLFDKLDLSSEESLFLYGFNTIGLISSGAQKTEFDCIRIKHPSDFNTSVYKIAFYHLTEARKQKLRKLAFNTGVLSEVYCDKDWIEFIPKGINKGTATKALQDKFHISIAETVAFGDNTNDIEMLRQAGITYAPADANPEIIRMCKYTTSNISNEIIKISQGVNTL